MQQATARQVGVGLVLAPLWKDREVGDGHGTRAEEAGIRSLSRTLH